jgi:hypothetical protein
MPLEEMFAFRISLAGKSQSVTRELLDIEQTFRRALQPERFSLSLQCGDSKL